MHKRHSKEGEGVFWPHSKERTREQVNLAVGNGRPRFCMIARERQESFSAIPSRCISILTGGAVQHYPAGVSIIDTLRQHLSIQAKVDRRGEAQAYRFRATEPNITWGNLHLPPNLLVIVKHYVRSHFLPHAEY